MSHLLRLEEILIERKKERERYNIRRYISLALRTIKKEGEEHFLQTIKENGEHPKLSPYFMAKFPGHISTKNEIEIEE